jgi:hypothetical protein
MWKFSKTSGHGLLSQISMGILVSNNPCMLIGLKIEEDKEAA